jgi:hypothetical protein
LHFFIVDDKLLAPIATARNADFMADHQHPRFGPVTYLGALGGVIFGLIGVAAAHTVTRPEAIRVALVSCIFLGVSLGIIAGVAVERYGWQPITRALRTARVSGHLAWIIVGVFTVQMVVGMVMSPFSGRRGQSLLWPFLFQLAVSLPQIIVWVAGIILLVGRWLERQRVDRLALAALAVMALAAASDWLLQLLWTYASYPFVLAYGRLLIRPWLDAIWLALLLAAVLADKSDDGSRREAMANG